MKNVMFVVLILAAVSAFGQDPDANDGKTLLRACSLALDVNVYHPRKVSGEREAFDLGFCRIESLGNREMCKPEKIKTITSGSRRRSTVHGDSVQHPEFLRFTRQCRQKICLNNQQAKRPCSSNGVSVFEVLRVNESQHRVTKQKRILAIVEPPRHFVKVSRIIP